MQLTLTINGQARDFDISNPSTTLSDIVDRMQLKADRVAVELNGVIAPRTNWTEIPVTTGDRLEVVHFVGGGASVSSTRKGIDLRVAA